MKCTGTRRTALAQVRHLVVDNKKWCILIYHTVIIFIFVGLTSDGYLRADGHPPVSRDYEEHLYVNTQNLDNMETSGGHKPESPKKDIFDMSELHLFDVINKDYK